MKRCVLPLAVRHKRLALPPQALQGWQRRVVAHMMGVQRWPALEVPVVRTGPGIRGRCVAAGLRYAW